jgi:hypothetical protein
MVLAIEHADFDGVERLAAVLGGEVTSTFDHPEQVILGECRSLKRYVLFDMMPFVALLTARYVLLLYVFNDSHVSLP